MSKITEALSKAETDRRDPTRFNLAASSHFRALKQELWEEVRSLEEAFKRRAAATAPKPQEAVSSASPPQPAAKPSAAAPSNDCAEARHASATPEAWDRLLQESHQQLVLWEQQAAGKLAEQASLQAKLGAAEQLLVDVQQEQALLKERLAQTAEAAASVEATRLACTRRLEALRECRLLAHEARVAEYEWQAHAQMASQLADSHQQLGQELARAEERGRLLRQRLENLQGRLGQALASTGPISSDSGHNDFGDLKS